MNTVQDQVALITGASSGIGRATAEELARAGMKVFCAARRKERLEELCGRIAEAGGEAAFAVTDVTRRDQVDAMMDAALERFGKVDVLFNNAGIMPLSLMRKCHVEEWEEMLDVNLRGLLYAIAVVLPHMLDRDRGHIINVASVAGHTIFPGGAVYCATKSAVVFISEGLRRELHPQANIRVSVISPGKVATELTDRITDQDIRKAFEQSEEQPLEAEAIARAVRYAVEQPEDVDVNEIIIRPTSQQL